MAEVGTIKRLEITGVNCISAGYFSLTGATSTVSKTTHGFYDVLSWQFKVRGTNTMTYTVSGTTATITGTNADVVDFVILGYK